MGTSFGVESEAMVAVFANEALLKKRGVDVGTKMRCGVGASLCSARSTRLRARERLINMPMRMIQRSYCCSLDFEMIIFGLRRSGDLFDATTCRPVALSVI